MRPSLTTGRAAVWATAISASILAPHAAPIALGLAVTKEGFDLLHARMHRSTVLSYIRAAPGDTYLKVEPTSGSVGVVLQTASSLSGASGGEEGACSVHADEEQSHSGEDLDAAEFCIKHRGDFLRYAASYARNMPDAEDAVSHAAMEIFRCYAESGAVCPPRYDDPVAWSKTVIRNYIIDLHRRNKTRRASIVKLRQPPSDMTEDVIDKILAQKMYEVIKGLNDFDHDVAVMRFAEGRAPIEIAQTLKCNAVTVRTSLFRTKNKMRRKLGLTPEPQRITPRESS